MLARKRQKSLLNIMLIQSLLSSGKWCVTYVCAMHIHIVPIKNTFDFSVKVRLNLH